MTTPLNEWAHRESTRLAALSGRRASDLYLLLMQLKDDGMTEQRAVLEIEAALLLTKVSGAFKRLVRAQEDAREIDAPDDDQ